jgi:hypothetical protein
LRQPTPKKVGSAALLNRAAGGRARNVAVSQLHEWAEEKRAALMTWGERVAVIVEGREAGGNVVAFTRGG